MTIQKAKMNLLSKLLLCVMLLATFFGVLFMGERKDVSANADTAPVDVTKTLGLEDRTSWGADAGEYYFGGVILNPFGYFNTAASVSQCWYVGNDAVIAANNGIDIMQYIYLNDKSARELITANANGDKLANSCSCWLSNPAASPVYVETTTGSGIIIRILKAYSGDTFTLTFKKGFSIIDSNNQVVIVNEDIVYNCTNGVLSKEEKFTLTFADNGETISTVSKKAGEAIGTLPEIPQKAGAVGVWEIDGKEINVNTTYSYGADKTATLVYYEGTDMLDTFDVTSWGTAVGTDCTYLRVGNSLDAGNNLMMYTSFANLHWQDHASTAAENYGCDVMEYIYINGKSARAISNENGTTKAYGGNEGDTFPFSIGGIYAPIDVYTNTNEFVILVMTDYVAATELTVTFKAGFRIKSAENTMLYLSEDFVYPYYTVTFEDTAVKVAPNGKVSAPDFTPTKEETESHTYVFDAWYNGENKWNFDDPVTGNLTLTAEFTAVEKEKFDVTFDPANGETASVVSVYTGSYVKEDQIPAAPQKEAKDGKAYVFLYWSLDGENAYDFTSSVKEAITLTAVYTSKPLYTVTMGDETISVVEGGKITKPADPIKEATAEYEYTFVGWYNGETEWDFETDTVMGDLELTAKFTETTRKYTITFVVTGNEAVTFEPVEVEYGTTYDLSNLLDGVDLSAYTYAITSGGVAVTSVTVISDVTVDVAFTERVYYTVTIDGVEQTVESGAKATKPATEPTKEATAEYTYTFDGWYNGETKWDFENDTVTGDLELTAKYTETKRKYTVSFVVTGNEAITLDSVEVEYGTTYDLSKLLEGKDVSGYSYSVSVDGVEKISVKVIGDTTVTVAFTKLASNEKAGGCSGSVSGMFASLLLSVAAFGVVAAKRKKED